MNKLTNNKLQNSFQIAYLKFNRKPRQRHIIFILKI